MLNTIERELKYFDAFRNKVQCNTPCIEYDSHYSVVHRASRNARIELKKTTTRGVVHRVSRNARIE